MKNNYMAETIVAWVEGLSIVAFVGFIFFDWMVSLASFIVFILALPARNYIKYRQFFPRNAKVKAQTSEVVKTSGKQMSEPLSKQASFVPERTI